MHQPENSVRCILLVWTVASFAVLALGSLLGGAPDVISATTETPRKAFDGDRIDVLIIDGGSADAALARRLDEHGDCRILLPEAGQAYLAWDYPRIIASGDSVDGDLTNDWGCQPQPGAIGYPIHATHSRVLGDSLMINDAVAIRARYEGFARWNLPGWPYDDLPPAFRRLETHQGNDLALHGGDGPLPVWQLGRANLSPMQRTSVNTTLTNGLKVIADFDGANVNGVGPYPMSVVNGACVNADMAYLGNAVRACANLSIHGDALVDRVFFEDKRVMDVRLTSGKETYTGEVILSAGACGNPVILLYFGVGPADELKALSIPSLADLPVGRRLKNHPFYHNAYVARSERIDAQSPAINTKLWTHNSQVQSDELDLHITATHLFPIKMSPIGISFVPVVALARP